MLLILKEAISFREGGCQIKAGITSGTSFPKENKTVMTLIKSHSLKEGIDLLLISNSLTKRLSQCLKQSIVLG